MYDLILATTCMIMKNQTNYTLVPINAYAKYQYNGPMRNYS